jgi:pimeloyl-ACP methyl ester carboxylesterase/predicted glycosyltransferase
MRGRQPDVAGTVDVDGTTIAYEFFGDGDIVLLLQPTWCVVHSHVWKMQVPYLSRHYRVVTWDGPGNGGSSRPSDPEPYTAEAHVRYALAVLDTLGVQRAIAVASSGGTHRTLQLAAGHPERISAVVFIGPLNHLIDRRPNEVSDALMSGELDRFLELFMAAAFAEPHSTKAIADGIEWGHGTTVQILVTSRVADTPSDRSAYRALCASIEQPVLVVQGTEDRLTPQEHGAGLAEAIGENARVVLVEGGGHRTDLRDPVRFAQILRDFVDSVTGAREPSSNWTRATSRSKRVLMVSSPIGLGHARRDLAIARELRVLRPGVQIDWLAQDPVTRVLDAASETVHPASAALVNECAHWTTESGEHYLHAFHAWRRMDEILTANFMVTNEVLESASYDLVIGDEAWEVDHFLHENPELKRTAYAWLTDFVGWLPMPEGGADEERLTSDYNLEMIDQIERFPRVRDRAIFVGDPEDVVGRPFGPGLPEIRAWTQERFQFAGYVADLEPITADERLRLREEIGFAPHEKVCVATVGGSGIGTSLLRRVIDSASLVRQKLPEFRLVAVAGPRIDPSVLDGAYAGVDVHGMVPELHRYLAACDVAVIQGGLTTAMELTALGRPFLSFPLGGHFEQRFHVPHRLRRYRAGRQMEYASTAADEIAATILEELDRVVDHVPVATDGAVRAAAMLADLI